MKIELTEEMAGAVIRGMSERADTLENDLLVVRTSEIGAQGSARAARQERDLAIKDRDEARSQVKVDGPAYESGRLEGHADVASKLRAHLDPEDQKHLTLDGLLDRVDYELRDHAHTKQVRDDYANTSAKRGLEIGAAHVRLDNAGGIDHGALNVPERIDLLIGQRNATQQESGKLFADRERLKARCEELSGALSRAHRAMRDAAREAKHCAMHALAGRLDEALKQAQPQKVRADLAGAPAAEAFDEAAGKPGAAADAFEDALEKAFWHFNKRVGDGEDMRTVFKFVVRDLVAPALVVRVNVSEVDQAKLIRALKEKVNAAGIDAMVGVADDEIAKVLTGLQGGGRDFAANLRKALAAGRAETLEDVAQAVRNTAGSIDKQDDPVRLLFLRLAEAMERVAGEAAGIKLAQPCCERDTDCDGNCDRHPVSAP